LQFISINPSERQRERERERERVDRKDGERSATGPLAAVSRTPYSNVFTFLELEKKIFIIMSIYFKLVFHFDLQINRKAKVFHARSKVYLLACKHSSNLQVKSVENYMQQ
jgi:hypothetical protein